MDIQIHMDGTPPADGLCVCYTELQGMPAFTDRKILMWFRGEWTYPSSDQKYRGRVYAWAMLPILKTELFDALQHQEKLEPASEPSYDL